MNALAELVTAARAMVPAGVSVGWADPRQDYSLLPDEGLARALPKRQREFSAGRAAARMAMARPTQPLPMRPDRAPHWPDGLCGSITHSDSACLAITAPLTLYRGLGIDLEPAAPLDRDLWETILTPPELHWVSRLPDADAGHTAKLIFSAKEAAYKAQHRVSERLFGFDGLRIVISEKTFTARFRQPVPGFDLAEKLQGRWQITRGQILTLVAIPA